MSPVLTHSPIEGCSLFDRNHVLSFRPEPTAWAVMAARHIGRSPREARGCSAAETVTCRRVAPKNSARSPHRIEFGGGTPDQALVLWDSAIVAAVRLFATAIGGYTHRSALPHTTYVARNGGGTGSTITLSARSRRSDARQPARSRLHHGLSATVSRSIEHVRLHACLPQLCEGAPAARPDHHAPTPSKMGVECGSSHHQDVTGSVLSSPSSDRRRGL